MKPKIFVGREVPEIALQSLRETCDVTVWPHEKPATPPQLREAVRDCEGFLCVMPDRVDDALLDAAPKLKVVANNAVGYDNIDVEACQQRGVLVGNTPDVLTETVADVTFALLLGAAWRLPQADAMVRSGAWQGWKPTDYFGSDVSGKTLGIVGFGRIGQAVAKRARGFSMRVLATSRSAHKEAAELGARIVELETLLRESDFVSLHCALNDETRGLIGAAQLAMMKPTAFFINTARGPIVDQKALTAALQNGAIAGAGLDVFDVEPLPPSDPLTQLSNVVLTPHVGSATESTRIAMTRLAVENILAGLRGEPLPHEVTT